MKTTLRYQISKKTTFKDEQIKNKILSQLRDYGYDIVDIEEHIIYFELKGWGLSGNQIGKADAGTVEIIPADNGSMLQLTFYINFIFNIVLFICLIFAVFYFDWMALILVLGLVLFTWLGLVITKARHKKLLEQIVAEGR
jgi:hypothetical protein